MLTNEKNGGNILFYMKNTRHKTAQSDFTVLRHTCTKRVPSKNVSKTQSLQMSKRISFSETNY